MIEGRNKPKKAVQRTAKKHVVAHKKNNIQEKKKQNIYSKGEGRLCCNTKHKKLQLKT